MPTKPKNPPQKPLKRPRSISKIRLECCECGAEIEVPKDSIVQCCGERMIPWKKWRHKR